MLANNTMIPSVQVGAGIPLQSGAMSTVQSVYPQQNLAPLQASLTPVQAGSVVQSTAQQNMAPVQPGSLLQLPPGSMVPVQAGNSIVYVPTQPVATQASTVNMSVQQPVQYQTQSVQYQTQSYHPEPVVEQQAFPQLENVTEAPEFGSTTTPQLRTLQPRIVRNELPPQYKQVTLPAKIVTTRLPPIGPPPTPELNFQLPPPPVETVQSVAYTQPVQQVQSVMIPQPVQQVQSVMVPQSIMVPQYQTASVPAPAYATSSIPQMSAPKFGTTSVVAQY
jgi:hypothetical protein